MNATTTTTELPTTHAGRTRAGGREVREVREVSDQGEVVDVRERAAIGRRLLAVDDASGAAAGAELDDVVAEGHRREVVLVAEIHDAHRRRPGVDEAWIETFGAAAVDINDVIRAYGGETIAVLGTRVVASFGVAQLADVFEATVTMNRRAALAADAGGGWLCSIGVATGDVIDAGSTGLGDLGVPLVGAIVDRALMLCSWAQAGAVLADERTARSPGGGAGAPDTDESSWSFGSTRSLADADGEKVEFRDVIFDRKGPADLPGPSRRVSDRQLPTTKPTRPAKPAKPMQARKPTPRTSPAVIPDPPGVRSNRRASNAAPRADAGSGSGSTGSTGLVTRDNIVSGRRTWSVGHVCCWFTDKGRGVVASVTGQEFYVDRRFLVAGAELPDTAAVYFVPRDPMARGRNPVAGVVLVEGSRLEVRVAHVDERGFGFAEVGDSLGTRQLLLLDLTSPRASGTQVGDWLLVEVVGLQHGPVALPVE